MANALLTPSGALSLGGLVTVDPNTLCWAWLRARDARGYAIARSPGPAGVTKRVYAHRYVYEYLEGPIPEGLELDHICANPGCVNPDHLEPVTHAENLRRARRRQAHPNAQKTHCANGHPFDEANTYVLRGHRFCRECNRLASRAYRSAR